MTVPAQPAPTVCTAPVPASVRVRTYPPALTPGATVLVGQDTLTALPAAVALGVRPADTLDARV